MSDEPPCDVEGCTDDSEYLLVSGSLCRECAIEKEPESVKMCDTVLGVPEINE